MSEVARWENRAPSVTAAAGGMRLVEWAQEADAAYHLAQKLTSTTFCPDAFRGKPADAAAAMLAGGELGLSPLTALSAFDVIQGRAAARAVTLRALVQSRGHEIVLVESTETRCRMRGRRAGTSEWQAVTWTIDRATRAKLTAKPNWQTQPQAMLVARATSEICRLVASDAILGIGGGYSAEEVADGSVGDAPAVEAPAETPAATGTRRMSRAKPVPVDPARNGPAPEPAPEPWTDSQRGMVFALFAEAGLSTRDEQLDLIETATGGRPESRADLTKAEAKLVIDALEHILRGEPEEPQP